MRKVYNYENATIIVLNANVCTSDKFKKYTEVFMKKVNKERNTHGNSDKTGNFN